MMMETRTRKRNANSLMLCSSDQQLAAPGTVNNVSTMLRHSGDAGTTATDPINTLKTPGHNLMRSGGPAAAVCIGVR